MGRLLRVVEGSRWDFADDLALWQDRRDLPAAPFGDLRPSASGKLSVWVIEDDDSNLDRVIAGFAASRPKIDPFEGRIVDAADVSALGIDSEPSGGYSKDKEANKRWHRNLIGLTYRQLGALANLRASRGIPLERDVDEVTQLILASVKAGHIKLEALRPQPGPTESSVWYVISEALKAEGYRIADS